MANRSKSTLFLIEQLIVIAVFAVCAVTCINILVSAYSNANNTRSISHAILKAESGAEVFKATGGDYEKMADIMHGFIPTSGEDTHGAALIVYYDDIWQISDLDNATYILYVVADTPRTMGDFTLSRGTLTVSRLTGDELITLAISSRG